MAEEGYEKERGKVPQKKMRVNDTKPGQYVALPQLFSIDDEELGKEPFQT